MYGLPGFLKIRRSFSIIDKIAEYGGNWSESTVEVTRIVKFVLP